MKLDEPFYIGDSVYVRLIDGMLELTTKNDSTPCNTIFLEPETWCALQQFVQRAQQAKSNDQG
jgi:hypothetical protein